MNECVGGWAGVVGCGLFFNVDGALLVKAIGCLFVKGSGSYF